MAWEDRDYNREGEARHPLRGEHPSRSVVMWFVAINLLVAVADYVLTNSQRGDWASPTYWGNFNIPQAIYGYQVWRFLSYQFLHAGIWHLMFNMLALLSFGPLVENWWGWRRFIAFYLLCGTCGAAMYTLFAFIPGLITQGWLVGASGSIFGILVSCAVINPNAEGSLLFLPIRLRMRTMALIFLSVACLSVIAGSMNSAGETAHLGGAVLGFVLTKFPGVLGFAERIRFRRKAPSNQWQKKKEKEHRRLIDEQAEVDEILDKVRQRGIQSLSRGEKKILQRATDRQRRED